jgi:hypothetical protein
MTIGRRDPAVRKLSVTLVKKDRSLVRIDQPAVAWRHAQRRLHAVRHRLADDSAVLPGLPPVRALVTLLAS